MRRAIAVSFFLALLLADVGMAGSEEKPSKPVNVNTASVEELAKLPGVGEVIAARIVRHREKSGRFRAVDELLIIRGISRKKLEALRPLVTVEAEEPQEKKETKEKEGET